MEQEDGSGSDVEDDKESLEEVGPAGDNQLTFQNTVQQISKTPTLLNAKAKLRWHDQTYHARGLSLVRKIQEIEQLQSGLVEIDDVPLSQIKLIQQYGVQRGHLRFGNEVIRLSFAKNSSGTSTSPLLAVYLTPHLFCMVRTNSTLITCLAECNAVN
jgi:hypothetical protein